MFGGFPSQRASSTESAQKRKCCHLDEIFITGCTESCQNDNFRCSQRWKFRQNDDITISVCIHELTSRYVCQKATIWGMEWLSYSTKSYGDVITYWCFIYSCFLAFSHCPHYHNWPQNIINMSRPTIFFINLLHNGVFFTFIQIQYMAKPALNWGHRITYYTWMELWDLITSPKAF